MINFWNDSWVPNIGSLAHQVHDNVGYLDLSKNLQDFVMGNHWDWQKFSNLLPINIVDKIKAMVPSFRNNVEDTTAWMHEMTIPSLYPQPMERLPGIILM